MGELEMKLKELKDIVRKIEQGDVDDIDESLELYKRGQTLVIECHILHEAAKEKIKRVEGSG
jgi:exodeoxyribonuclease VII small subunit